MQHLFGGVEGNIEAALYVICNCAPKLREASHGWVLGYGRHGLN
jgi:hypothetical protein